MQSTDPSEIALGLSEVGVALLKHLGIHEGRFQVAIGFRLGVGGIPGEKDGVTIPGAMVGVENVSLIRVDAVFQGPNVLDAAKVNPARKASAKKVALKRQSAKP